MLDPATPLTHARAAMVQDLYQMAFYRQLAARDSDAEGSCSRHGRLTDLELSTLLQDYAAVLVETEYREDAVLLMGLAMQTAPRVRMP